MQMAGIQHVTVSAALLNELSRQDSSSWGGELGAYFAEGPSDKSWQSKTYQELFHDENAWKIAFTRSGFGASEGKIVQAINYFCDFQEQLEKLVLQHGDLVPLPRKMPKTVNS